jgi:hypothetical protein
MITLYHGIMSMLYVFFPENVRIIIRHRHSGIDVSPVPLVTEHSGSAQLWQNVSRNFIP